MRPTLGIADKTENWKDRCIPQTNLIETAVAEYGV